MAPNYRKFPKGDPRHKHIVFTGKRRLFVKPGTGNGKVRSYESLLVKNKFVVDKKSKQIIN